MVQLNLSQHEAAVLSEVLQGTLSDLRMEIAGTENMNFRENLKEREAILRKAIEEIRNWGSSEPDDTRLTIS